MAKGIAPQIKGESIQSLYSLYTKERLLANRRYQRKLVWTIEEKRRFIDSIKSGYPIPLILLANVSVSGEPSYEIIDGMQRLNSIMSFIEQEFSIEDQYFDLNTIADTKLKFDSGELKQKETILDRKICAEFSGYQVPISIYLDNASNDIDEVFRRLNSNGRHLSRQELRQAGSTSMFASIVRKLSSKIRGDSSNGDVLSLNNMKKISITNRDLEYGINVDDVFWVSNKILLKEDLRDSKDEEIVADLVAWIVSDRAQRSSSSILDGYYGFSEDVTLSQAVDRNISKHGEERICQSFQSCFDCIIEVINKSKMPFRDLIFESKNTKIPRFFQIYFLAFYDLIFEKHQEVANYKNLINSLKDSGDKLKLSEGGGNWSATEKEAATNQVIGMIQNHFKNKGSTDPSRKYFISRFENILMNSTTEQTLYDFKAGFYDLVVGSKFGVEQFSKAIKTLTAMANTQKGAIGYVIVGVCDKKSSAQTHGKIYGSDSKKYNGFYVTGIDGEAVKYEKTVDSYFTKLTALISSQPISDRDRDYIGRHIFTTSYYEKIVLIMSLESGPEPSEYSNSYFVRHGSNIQEVKGKDILELSRRFSSGSSSTN